LPAPRRRAGMSARRGLQIAVAVLGLVPVGAGLGGVLLGPIFSDGIPGSIDADSHFRYLSGLLLAIGLGFWSTIPRIERHTLRFRLLTALVFLGGLARLLSLVQWGPPGAGMLFGLGMELVVTPLLCLWQGRVAHGERPVNAEVDDASG